MLTDYVDLLRQWKVSYAPKTPFDQVDARFDEACHSLDYMNSVANELAFSPPKQKATIAAKMLRDPALLLLEERIDNLKKETVHEQVCTPKSDVA